MKFFKPIPVTDPILEISSDDATYYTNVAEPDTSATAWAVGTTYAAGAKVYVTSPVRKMFISLVSSNVGNDPTNTWGFWEEAQMTEAGLSAWSSATTYTAGQQCYISTNSATSYSMHRIFESVVGGNLNKHPVAAGEGYWIEVGPTNRQGMFDASSGSYTEYLDTSGDLSSPLVAWFDITGLDIDVLTVLDVSGADVVTCQFFDTSHAAISGFPENSYTLLTWDTSIPVGWYWWFYSETQPLSKAKFYLDQPPSAVYLKVTVSQEAAGVPIRIGTMAFGRIVSLGDTQFGASLGIMDFSKKERDTFGVFSVIERGYAKLLSCDSFLTNEMVSSAYAKLADIRATPVVWIGSDETTFESTIVYGFYKSFNIILETAGGSMCNLEIEGLV